MSSPMSATVSRTPGKARRTGENPSPTTASAKLTAIRRPVAAKEAAGFESARGSGGPAMGCFVSSRGSLARTRAVPAQRRGQRGTKRPRSARSLRAKAEIRGAGNAHRPDAIAFARAATRRGGEHGNLRWRRGQTVIDAGRRDRVLDVFSAARTVAVANLTLAEARSAATAAISPRPPKRSSTMTACRARTAWRRHRYLGPGRLVRSTVTVNAAELGGGIDLGGAGLAFRGPRLDRRRRRHRQARGAPNGRGCSCRGSSSRARRARPGSVRSTSPTRDGDRCAGHDGRSRTG
jgi:hypothetical protein